MAARGSSAIEQARNHYRRKAWSRAFAAFVAADGAIALEPEDLERLATSAYLIGRDDDYLQALDRAHRAYIQCGERLRSARCAFWLALRLFLRGEDGHATGWFARAERLVEAEDERCAERGYLLLPVAQRHLNVGEFEAAYSTAAAAGRIGERCAEPDLIACARHLQGRTLITQGQIAPGLALLDEAMLAVASGDLSPVMTGLLYCSVIEACQQAYAVGRAREWTFALFDWCEQQPEMVSFTGTCLVHRAEVMQFNGAWEEAVAEARRASERCLQAANQQAAAAASYQAGEVLRLRGEFAQAEQAYRDASRRGREPQPGLALLRLAQGRVAAAASAVRRVARTTEARLRRLGILPAYVDIMIAAGDAPAAREACNELEELAADIGAEAVDAMAAQARGAVELADGDPRDALQAAQRAWSTWQRLGAPYQAARSRVLIGWACEALGDHDGAALELDAAGAVFERLGASPDLRDLDSLRQRSSPIGGRGLTQRELQILRLLATGKTNRAIASELSLSERTIDRHVSNIFAKLGVSSRAAATAYAFRHHLV
jgi:DNA-binding CsgD family transcriptional regulator